MKRLLQNLALEIFLFSLDFHDVIFKIHVKLGLFKKSKKQEDQNWPLFI